MIIIQIILVIFVLVILIWLIASTAVIVRQGKSKLWKVLGNMFERWNQVFIFLFRFYIP